MVGAHDGSAKRSRWAALGAAVAVSIGAGGLMSASATIDAGNKPVFIPIPPCRVADLRPAPDTVGPRATPLGSAETYSFPVRGDNGKCVGIPADAFALVLNVAVINPSAPSYITVFPSDLARPLAANLNVAAGQAPVSNAATVRIGTDGRISIFNFNGTVNLAVDISGYYVDHTHDDRYYTKTQIDAFLQAKANTPITGNDVTDGSLTNEDISVYYASVTANAVLFASSGGITAGRSLPALPASTGRYTVEFGRNILNCAYTVTIGTGVVGLYPSAGAPARWGFTEVAPLSPTSVGVHTFDQAEIPADMPFHLTVIC